MNFPGSTLIWRVTGISAAVAGLLFFPFLLTLLWFGWWIPYATTEGILREMARAPNTEAAQRILTRHLKARNPEVRRAAVQALAYPSEEEDYAAFIVTSLMEALSDPDPGVREEAVKSCAKVET